MRGARRGARLALLVAMVSTSLSASVSACSRPGPDATPEGVVKAFVDKMESSESDARAVKEAYAFLGPRARQNLKGRAERASRGQGRRTEPWEMLAEGRFGLKFRPKAMTSRVQGDEAWVDVVGESADERATVHCAREGAAWRVEPDLPDPAPPTKRGDGGI